MIETIIRFVSVFFLYFILLLFPFSSYTPQQEVTLRFFHSYQNNEASYLLANANTQTNIPFVQSLLPQNDTGGFSQYRIRQLDDGGNIRNEFIVPPQKNLTIGNETIRINGNGFLTYPDDGSIFIWFPRLGGHVYYFDNEGRFLWQLNSTQYLQSFPSGRWMLSVAGDHSRFQIRLPNLEPMVDVEGMLLNDFRLSPVSSSNHTDDYDNKTENDYLLCGGFIDGDIAFVQPNVEKEKQVKRIRTKKLLKSLWCNFSKNLFAVQLEEKQEGIPRDVIHFARIDKINKTDKAKDDDANTQPTFADTETFSSWLFSFPLPSYFPYKLPLAISGSGEEVALLLPTKEEHPQALLLDSQGELKYRLLLNANFFDPDDWRITVLGDNFIFWNSEALYVLRSGGLIFAKKIPSIKTVKIAAHNIYVNSQEGIYSYTVNDSIK